MVTLDQISQLETKVEKAIQLIQSLKAENDSLRIEIGDKDKRIEELENLILVFKNDQIKIEEGIINALNHLSAFEDTVYQTKSDSPCCSCETEIDGRTEVAANSESENPTDTSDNPAEQMEIF